MAASGRRWRAMTRTPPMVRISVTSRIRRTVRLPSLCGRAVNGTRLPESILFLFPVTPPRSRCVMTVAVQKPPSPEIVFETLNAYQRTQALRAAIELDLFSAIGQGKTTSAAIAERISASPKGTRVLCDYLTIIGLLTKNADGSYGLTADTALFLDRKSPAYMGSVAEFLGKIPDENPAYRNITGAVRKGGTVGEGTVEPENPIWV